MTKKKKTKHKRRKHKQDHRPIQLPTIAVRKLEQLPPPHNANCIALYLFYLRKAVLDKTNRIWCTDNYVAEGLQWAINRVKHSKRLLVEMKYIRVIQKHDSAGHFAKSYVEVRYYATKMKIEKESYLRMRDKDAEELFDWVKAFTSEKMKMEIRIAELEQQIAGGVKKTPAVKSTVSVVSPPAVKRHCNTYRKETKELIENKVATKDGDKNSTLRVSNGVNKHKRFYEKCCSKLMKALQAKKRIYRKPNKNKWIAQFEKLHIDDGVKKDVIKEILLWYVQNIGKDGVPEAFSAETFRNKFDAIVAAMYRDKKEKGYDIPDDYPMKTWMDGDIEVTEIDYGG